MSKWSEFKERWKDCRECPLHLTRRNVVLARGVLPADLLFVGEAPGKSEDLFAQPFIGQAGYLLDQMIKQTVPDDIRYAITNMVCCIPYDDSKEKRTRVPLIPEIKACSTRLLEFIDICKPKLIIAVGTTARDFMDSKMKHSVKIPRTIAQDFIDHPVNILRTPTALRTLAVQRAVVTIRRAVEEYLGGEDRLRDDIQFKEQE